MYSNIGLSFHETVPLTLPSPPPFSRFRQKGRAGHGYFVKIDALKFSYYHVG